MRCRLHLRSFWPPPARFAAHAAAAAYSFELPPHFPLCQVADFNPSNHLHPAFSLPSPSPRLHRKFFGDLPIEQQLIPPQDQTAWSEAPRPKPSDVLLSAVRARGAASEAARDQLKLEAEYALGKAAGKTQSVVHVYRVVLAEHMIWQTVERKVSSVSEAMRKRARRIAPKKGVKAARSEKVQLVRDD